MGRRFSSLLPLIGGLLFILLPATQAQSIQGSILGSVRDPSGAAVPGASVTLTNEGTNDLRTQSTDAAGDYRFAGIQPGAYRVSVEAAGFQMYVQRGINLDSSQIRRIDAEMRVGDIATAITVEGGAISQVETETATLSNVKEARDFGQLPLSPMGRGWNNIAIAVAGVQSQSGFQVNGARDTANNFTADGVSVNDIVSSRQTANGFVGDVDTIAELKVMTANNSAEFAQVAQFSAVTKSGENREHGSIYWGNYNSALSARKWQDRSGPSFENFNMFSVTNGGPVFIPKLYDGRNKTFYFFSYGGGRYRTGARTETSIPPMAFRQGDFSSLLPDIRIVDPLSGVPFINNQIPQNRISPVTAAVQSISYPAPNMPGQGDLGLINNYYADPGGQYDGDNLSVRIDQKLSERNNLFVRTGFTINNKDTWMGPLNNGYGDGWWGNHPARNVTISDTHTFTPTIVNEAKLGFSRDYAFWFAPNWGEDVQLGIQGIANPAHDPAISGMPDFGFDGSNWFQGTGTWANGDSQAQNTYQFIDNLSWFRGRHNIKFGMDFRLYQINDQSKPQNMRGQFSFDDRLSGFNYANFLLGMPSGASLAIPRPNAYVRSAQQGYYVQDEFKLSQRLTLTFGLRYEYQRPWKEKFNRMFNFDAASGSLITAGSSMPTDLVPAVAETLPIKTAAQAGFPIGGLTRPDRNNFSPRMGLAFRPFGDDQTVVRAGYGWYTSMMPGLLALSATGGPWQSTQYFRILNNEPSIRFPAPFAGTADYAGMDSTQGVNPTFPQERTQQWNVSVGRQIWKTAIDVAYIGTKADHLPFNQDLNLPYPSTAPFDWDSRPYSRFSSVRMIQNGSSSVYHGMTIQADRRMAMGFKFNVNYTLAKALTNGDLNSYNAGFTQNQWNTRLERSDDLNIRRQTLIFNYIYELPFGKGKPVLADARGVLNQLVSGWQAAGITSMLTGARLSPSFSGEDPANTDQWSGRPDRIGDGNLDAGEMRGNIQSRRPIFDKSAFVTPVTGRGYYGNSARGILTGPGTVLWNMVLSKSFALPWEGTRLQFRSELFNAFNHANFRAPSTNITSSGFGLVTGAGAARRILFGLRLEF